MAKMIFDLTEEDRSALERIRIARGLRSHAETLRAMIRGESGEPSLSRDQISHIMIDVTNPARMIRVVDDAASAFVPLTAAKASPDQARLNEMFSMNGAMRAAKPKAAIHVDAPVLERKAFNPQPKTGKPKR